MQESKQFKKNFIWNTLGTGLNAFNSLFFMIIATRVNGVDKAGIFTLAFTTACILYAIGVYAGRIYQVTELNKKITDIDFIISKTITSIAMIIFLLLFCVFKKYDIEKTMVFLALTIYKALDAFCDVIYGVLQKNERLDIVGKSLTMKSIISVIAFLVVDLITKNMLLAIGSIIFIYVLISIIYDFNKAKKYIEFNIKAKFRNIVDIFKRGFFIFIISFLNIYVINVPKYSIDNYLGNDIQTIFGILIMPATIISLVAQFLIYPYLNKIVDLYKERDIKGFKKVLSKIICVVILFGILATILGYLLGTQVLGIVYGLDLSIYKMNLAIIIIAATLYAIGTIYSSVLTTFRETFSQFIIYMSVSIFAWIVSNIFTNKFGINGAVWAYFCIMIIFSSMYIIYTSLKLKNIFSRENENEGEK